jgi:hypothetical protein
MFYITRPQLTACAPQLRSQELQQQGLRQGGPQQPVVQREEQQPGPQGEQE